MKRPNKGATREREREERERERKRERERERLSHIHLCESTRAHEIWHAGIRVNKKTPGTH